MTDHYMEDSVPEPSDGYDDQYYYDGYDDGEQYMADETYYGSYETETNHEPPAEANDEEPASDAHWLDEFL